MENDRDLHIDEFLRKNMPTLKELAPEKYQELIDVGAVLAQKYSEKAMQLLREEGLPEAGIGVAVATGAATAVGTAAGSIIAKKIG